MGLLSAQLQRPGLLGGYNPAQPVIAPAAAQAQALLAQPMPSAAPAPRRGVNPLRVLDGFLFGPGTIGENIDRERMRPQVQAEAERARIERERIAELVRSLPQEAQIAFALNPEKLGEALSTRSEARVLDQGDVYLENGRPSYAAPFEAAPGSSVFDPLNPNAPIARAPSEAKVAGGALVDGEGRVLYRGPQVEGVASTADAFYTPEIAGGQGGGAPVIARQARPDGYTLAPGQQRYENGVMVGESTAQRPMTAVDRRQLREDQDAVQSVTGVNERLDRTLTQINNGTLNFGPVANATASIRNRLGMSDENSRNQASFRATMESLRNESLRLNAGVQTDGDAQRAWNELFSNINDEGVVKQRLAEIKALNERAIQYRQDRIADAQAQGGGAQSASPSAANITPEQARQMLRERGVAGY